MSYAYPNMAYKDYIELMKKERENLDSYQSKDIVTMLRTIENFHVDYSVIKRIKSLASVVGSYSKGFEISSREIGNGIDPIVEKCEEKLDKIRNLDNSGALKSTIDNFKPSKDGNKLLALKLAVDQALIDDCKRKIAGMQDAICEMLNRIDKWIKNEVFLPAKVPFYLDDRRKEREENERD